MGSFLREVLLCRISIVNGKLREGNLDPGFIKCQLDLLIHVPANLPVITHLDIETASQIYRRRVQFSYEDRRRLICNSSFFLFHKLRENLLGLSKVSAVSDTNRKVDHAEIAFRYIRKGRIRKCTIGNNNNPVIQGNQLRIEDTD